MILTRKLALWFSVVLGLVVTGVAFLPWAAPRILSWLHPDIAFRGEDAGRLLYLTIDDAPSENTGRILEVLRRHGVPATFFIIGSWVRDEGQLRAIVANGNELGHHLWTTQRCSRLPLEQFEREFDETDRVLAEVKAARLFRPPSDFGTAAQLDYVRSKGYRAVLGTVFPLDSSLTNPRVLSALVEWLAVPQGIVILHDGRVRGRVTAEVLDEIVPALKAKGYEFRLLSGKALAPR